VRKHRKDEQEFFENIDRMMAGEDISIGNDADDDVRATIEFSRKLTDMHTGPSTEFKEQLKSRLLMKLTGQDVAARQKIERNWFRDILDKLVPQSPVWRTATVTVVMLVAVVSVLWRTGLFTGTEGVGEELLMKGVSRTQEEAGAFGVEESEAATAESPRMGITAEDSAPAPEIVDTEASVINIDVTPIGANVFDYGSEINYRFTLTNVTGETITITPFPPRITIIGGGVLRPVRIIPEGDQSREIAPSGSVEHELTWDQRDDNGALVEPGWYNVLPGSSTVNTGDESLVFNYPALPPLLIQYPQGAMVRTIELALTDTIGGLTVILERIELQDRGITLHRTMYHPRNRGQTLHYCSGLHSQSIW